MAKNNLKPALNRTMEITIFFAGAVCLALSMPATDYWFLAWFCLVPLLEAVKYRFPGRPFRVTWVYATIFFCVSFFWVTHSVVNYGGLHWSLAGIVLFIMSGICGLFPATAVKMAEKFETANRFWAAGNILVLPTTWVAMEYVRAHLPLGLAFPWNALGQSQHAFLPVLQNADWGSFYGISFILVVFNIGIHSAIRRTSHWKFNVILSTGLAVLSIGYGAWRLRMEIPEPGYTVGIVQGNVPVFSPRTAETRYRFLQDQIRLSKAVANEDPDLIIWSESCIPFIYRYAWRYQDGEKGSPGEHLARMQDELNLPLIAGTVDRVDEKIFNAAVLALPNGRDHYYYKQKLVPFGEYVPMEKALFFVNRMVDESIGTFDRGTSALPFEIPDGPRVTMTICYENIFPELNRERVNAGGEFICNITNDAWFGDSDAPYQHFTASKFRAVETRRTVVRAANSGLSGVVDPFGRVLKISSLFTQESFTVKISPNNVRSPYLVIGDSFPIACVVMTIVLCCGTILYGKRKKVDGGKNVRRKS